MAEAIEGGRAIRVDHVRKVYEIDHRPVEVLKDIDVTIDAGDIVAVVGKSGCGKSTLLRLIAGLERADGGRVLIGDEPVETPTLDVGVLFQESRLLPWLTVEKNVAFGLPEGVDRAERERLVAHYIKLVGLEGFEQALPGQLSGGMQKRVAIARTLINRPHILLLDEPFGALDAFTKMNLQNEVLNIWRREHMTCVVVTHDIDEAIFLGNRVIVMSAKPGVVQNVIDVDIASPKDRTDHDFDLIRKRVYGEFFEEPERRIEYVI